MNSPHQVSGYSPHSKLYLPELDSTSKTAGECKGWSINRQKEKMGSISIHENVLLAGLDVYPLIMSSNIEYLKGP